MLERWAALQRERKNIIGARAAETLIAQFGDEKLDTLPQYNLITPQQIIGEVSSYFNLEEGEIFLDNKTRRISHPRQIAYSLIRDISHLELADIGNFFDRDHSTVHHGIKQVKSRVRVDEDTKRAVSAIRTNIGVKYLGEPENNEEHLVAEKDRQMLLARNALAVVSEYFEIDQDILLSKNRKKDVVYARRIAMYIAKRLTTLSFEEVGQIFSRPHANIYYNVISAGLLCQKGGLVKREIADIVSILSEDFDLPMELASAQLNSGK